MAGVQGPNPGKQNAGGIAGLFGREVDKARGPNAAAYDEERARAAEASTGFSNSGAENEKLSYNYDQQGPQIANQYQDQSRQSIAGNIGKQNVLADKLLRNNGEASKAQFQSGLDQSIAAQMSTANSTAGGSVAQAGAARNAAATGAQMRAQGSSEAARLGALERQAALGQAAGVYNNVGGQLQNVYGLEQGSAIAQGQLDSTNQAQENQMKLGYGQLGLGYAGQENAANGQALNALNSYTQADLAAQGLSAGLKGADTADTNQMIGIGTGIAGGAAGVAGGMMNPKAAQGGAIGRAPNSIAEVYGNGGAEVRQHTASLAQALAGIEALKAQLMGQARAEGGPISTGDATDQWERNFGSVDQAKADVLKSDNRAEAAKIRANLAEPQKPSSLAGALAGASAGLSGISKAASGGGNQGPDWSEYMNPRFKARAEGGSIDIGGAGSMSNGMIQAASTGLAGDTGGVPGMVGGGGVTGGAVQHGMVGGGGGMVATPTNRLAAAFRGRF